MYLASTEVTDGCVGGSPTRVLDAEAADLDGDGRADLAVTVEGRGVTLLSGGGL